ncbi:MAG: hypothetical protein K0B11_04320 [Mariniphaga sp.]|nr:hypothetical protein [Mariniphaga sp.]
MKKLIFTLFFFLYASVLMAQVPAGFSYQAVVRNNSGEVVAGKTVKFKFSILQNSATGTPVYVETQSKETSAFGLANLVVGTGIKVSGNFDPSAWGSNSHYLKVELDPNNGNAFSHLGTMQLMAVPYAFHAKTVEIEADGDSTNELQELSISGTNLSLSKGGGTVTLPSSGGGDNWGTDYVRTDATLTGQGTMAQPLKIAQQSATTGQVLKWNGTTWVPATDETGEGGGSPTGTAGGDLTGTYPDPTIGTGKVTEDKISDNAITSAKIADGTIAAADIADNAVTNSKILNTAVSTDKLANSAITAPKLASMGASAGQVLKWDGTTWEPSNDKTSESGGSPTGTAGGDLTGTYPDPTIGKGKVTEDKISDNAITSAKIADGTIAAADIADNAVTNSKILNTAVSTDKLANSAITAPKLSSMGASAGQVLKWDGTTWAPANDETGTASNPFVSSDGLTKNNFLADDFVFGSMSLDKIEGTQDYDSRMFFNKSSGSFRAGETSDDSWNEGNTGLHSAAFGFNTKASGIESFASGRMSYATGVYSTALGVSTLASGMASTAIGGATKATGQESISMGNYTVAAAKSSVAIGRYNVGAGSGGSWIETDPVFEIGIGSSDTQKANAVTVLKNGNVGIGPANPTAKLEVGGQVKITGGNPGSGKVLTSDANGLASWQSASGGLSLPYSGDCSSGDAAFSINQSGTGQAIYVYNPSFTEGITSISASNNSPSGIGIESYMHASWGNGTGIMGIVQSSNGTGLMGIANAASGVNYGVVGESKSTQGTGVLGYSSTTSGVGYGIVGHVSSSYSYSGYFDGGKVYISGNTGIGITNPGAKLEVNGQVKITGGSPGEGKVLTSDAAGLASWQTPASNQWIKSGSNIYFNTGNVGIGVNNPAYKFEVVGNTRINLKKAEGTWLAMRTDGSTGILDFSFAGGKLAIEGNANGEDIVLNPAKNSKVGIRTWTPRYELDVNGRIRATGSVYYGGTTSTDGTAYNKPDYVFAEDYIALPTEEVELFLKENSHLPWVTSAEQEKQENGEATDMTRMAFETLEAVENLQLQIINQQKLIKEQQVFIEWLQFRLSEIENNLKSSK